MSPVVVTGGFGYVGGRIVQKLLSDGFDVRVSTRRTQAAIPSWARSTVQWGSDLKALCDGAGSLVHLAAPNEIICAEDPQRGIAETVALSEQALAAAAGAGVRRFIYFSTVHVYGPLLGFIDESTPPAPHHPYGEAHLASEAAVEAAAGENLAAIALRLSNGFGAPADNGTDRWSLLVNDLCRQAVQDRRIALKSGGRQLRDFLPLGDITAATAHFLKHPVQTLYDVINLSSGKAVSARVMAATILSRAKILLGDDISLHIPESGTPDEAPHLVIDNGRLRDAGFCPAADPLDEIDGLLEFCLQTWPANRHGGF